MPFGGSKGFTHRKRVSGDSSTSSSLGEAASTAAAAAPPRPMGMTACERYLLFAHLGWLTSYREIFALECDGVERSSPTGSPR